MCTVPIRKGIISGSKIQVDLSSKSAQTLNTVRNVLYYAALLENTNCIIKSQKELALGLMYIGSDGTTSERCIIIFGIQPIVEIPAVTLINWACTLMA